MSNYAFLKNPEGIIKVVSSIAIEETRVTDLYDRYGQLFDYESCAENVDTVQAINYYHNGNWRSIPLDGEEYGVSVEYKRITDEEEIAFLNAILEEMEYVSEGYGIKRWRSGVHAVLLSQFATDFALYEIELNAFSEEEE